LRVAAARSVGDLASSFRGRARLSLLEVFEREQQLILRQRLGATPEAMALQFLDDLWASRSLRICSAISITFSVSGSSGSASRACGIVVTRP
jgi:hypothetical protein